MNVVFEADGFSFLFFYLFYWRLSFPQLSIFDYLNFHSFSISLIILL